MKDLYALIGAITGGFIFIILFVIYSAFAWGYVATITSSWYILPLFPEFPKFTWMQYAGINYFLVCFFHSTGLSELKDEYKDNTAYWTTIILFPWFVLFGAWILKLFY